MVRRVRWIEAAGFAFGFLGMEHGNLILHSHMLAVREPYRPRSGQKTQAGATRAGAGDAGAGNDLDIRSLAKPQRASELWQAGSGLRNLQGGLLRPGNIQRVASEWNGSFGNGGRWPAAGFATACKARIIAPKPWTHFHDCSRWFSSTVMASRYAMISRPHSRASGLQSRFRAISEPSSRKIRPSPKSGEKPRDGLS